MTKRGGAVKLYCKKMIQWVEHILKKSLNIKSKWEKFENNIPNKR